VAFISLKPIVVGFTPHHVIDSRKPRPTMAVSGMFALFYGIFRFIVEFVRVPDAQLGYIAFGWLTMGQLLCVPMIVGGLFLIWLAYNRKPTAKPAV